MGCLWCDEPTVGDNLCAKCRAVNDGPVFHCSNPRHPVPTLGTSCFECDLAAEHEARARAVNAPIVESLVAIRAQLIADLHRPWPGAEFCKGLFGISLDKAIASLGGVP